MNDLAVKTPCIGVCSTSIGGSVCRGCKRFAHEIIGWNGFSEAEKLAIVSRLESLLAMVVDERIRVLETEKLKQIARDYKMRVDDDAHILSFAYEVMRRFGSQLSTLDAIGCTAKPRWAHVSVVDMCKSIDEDFYRLSCAHFERYFPGAM